MPNAWFALHGLVPHYFTVSPSPEQKNKKTKNPNVRRQEEVRRLGRPRFWKDPQGIATKGIGKKKLSELQTHPNLHSPV